MIFGPHIHDVSEHNIGLIRTARELWPHIKPEGRRGFVAKIRQSQAYKHYVRTGTWLEADTIKRRRTWPRKRNGNGCPDCGGKLREQMVPVGMDAYGVPAYEPAFVCRDCGEAFDAFFLQCVS